MGDRHARESAKKKEANEHPSTDASEQYTILDGLKLLSDDKFRSRVLAKVSDPYLLEWWGRDFRSWHRQYKADALAPDCHNQSSHEDSHRSDDSLLGHCSLQHVSLLSLYWADSTTPFTVVQGLGGGVAVREMMDDSLSLEQPHLTFHYRGKFVKRTVSIYAVNGRS